VNYFECSFAFLTRVDVKLVSCVLNKRESCSFRLNTHRRLSQTDLHFRLPCLPPYVVVVVVIFLAIETKCVSQFIFAKARLIVHIGSENVVKCIIFKRLSSNGSVHFA